LLVQLIRQEFKIVIKLTLLSDDSTKKGHENEKKEPYFHSDSINDYGPFSLPVRREKKKKLRKVNQK